jgi:hypothetical protein
VFSRIRKAGWWWITSGGRAETGDERIYQTGPKKLRRDGHRQNRPPEFYGKLKVCGELFHGFAYQAFMASFEKYLKKMKECWKRMYNRNKCC